MSLLARILPRPLLSLVILALWVVLAPEPSAGQILLGAALALVMPPLTKAFWPDPPRVADWLAATRLGFVVLFDIITANIEVARRVLGPIERLRPRFLDVPLEIEDPLVATILGSIVSLTPGTVSCEIDRRRRVLIVHALHVEDPEADIARIKARYEAPLKKVFAC